MVQAADAIAAQQCFYGSNCPPGQYCAGSGSGGCQIGALLPCFCVPTGMPEMPGLLVIPFLVVTSTVIWFYRRKTRAAD